MLGEILISWLSLISPWASFFAGLSITHPQIWAPCARASWSTQCGTYITSIVSEQHLDWRWFCFKFETTAQNFANNIQCKLRRNFFVHNTVSQNWNDKGICWKNIFFELFQFISSLPIVNIESGKSWRQRFNNDLHSSLFNIGALINITMGHNGPRLYTFLALEPSRGP